MNSFEMKTKLVSYLAYHRRYRPVVVEWEDRDVACLDANRCVIEYEVKISLSDLRADAKKTYKHRCMQEPQNKIDPRTVTRFYYAVPKELEEMARAVIDERYPYAGLAVIGARYPFVTISKTGKTFHGVPVSDERYEKLVEHQTFEIARLMLKVSKMEPQSETSDASADTLGQSVVPEGSCPAETVCSTTYASSTEASSA